MKGRSLLSLAAVVGTACSQNVFEPSDFNVTEALIHNGVDVSTLLGLANLTEKRSLISPCATAVRHPTF